ncbi:hypothetical protein Tco_0050711, partial [Tanacetum coccineum]
PVSNSEFRSLSSTWTNDLKSLHDEVSKLVDGSVEFAVYEALMPCRCGFVKHEVGDADKRDHNKRHWCLVDTTRGYDDLISLAIKRETQIPVDFIVNL